MKPSDTWVSDWSYGIEPALENKVSEELIDLFSGFWIWAGLEEKSKKTQARYSSSLQALGGYLVREVGEGNMGEKSTTEFLYSNVNDEGGPWVYYDNEAWQKELDVVCRKISKYMATL